MSNLDIKPMLDLDTISHYSFYVCEKTNNTVFIYPFGRCATNTVHMIISDIQEHGKEMFSPLAHTGSVELRELKETIVREEVNTNEELCVIMFDCISNTIYGVVGFNSDFIKIGEYNGK